MWKYHIKRTEVFTGKRTRCGNCGKTIKNGDTSWVVRRKRKPEEVVARFCTEMCEEEKLEKMAGLCDPVTDQERRICGTDPLW